MKTKGALRYPQAQTPSVGQGFLVRKTNDGSAEVFISQAAIDRMKRGANRP
jgi:hypothetical protein